MTKHSDRWLEASDVISMFPTFVWKAQLRPEFRQSLDANILAALNRMRTDLPALSVGQAWQSEHRRHELDEFSELVGCANDLTRSALRFLSIGYDDFEITGFWVNVLAPGAAQRMHSHPNNFLSGVYYLQAGPGTDTINFHDPRIQAGIIRPPVTELTAENTDQVVVRVTGGTLLLFPAYLLHSVDANLSNKERISISFNVMFSSFPELLSRPLW